MWKLSTDNDWIDSKEIENATTLSHKITEGIKPGQTYWIVVTAINAIGESIHSEKLIITCIGVPGIPIPAIKS
jgi:hypothetical protein